MTQAVEREGRRLREIANSVEQNETAEFVSLFDRRSPDLRFSQQRGSTLYRRSLLLHAIPGHHPPLPLLPRLIILPIPVLFRSHPTPLLPLIRSSIAHLARTLSASHPPLSSSIKPRIGFSRTSLPFPFLPHSVQHSLSPLLPSQ